MLIWLSYLSFNGAAAISNTPLGTPICSCSDKSRPIVDLILCSVERLGYGEEQVVQEALQSFKI